MKDSMRILIYGKTIYKKIYKLLFTNKNVNCIILTIIKIR